MTDRVVLGDFDVGGLDFHVFGVLNPSRNVTDFGLWGGLPEAHHSMNRTAWGLCGVLFDEVRIIQEWVRLQGFSVR